MTGRRPRWATALVAGVVVIAACATDPAETTEAVEATSTTAADPGPADTTPSAGPDATSSPATPAPSVGTTPTSPSTTGSPSGPPATDRPAPVPALGPVGDYGPWYLRADAATSIVLEVRSQAGAEPSGATITAVRNILAEVSGKSVSTIGGSVAGAAKAWTPDDIRAEADRTGPPQTTDGAVLTLLYVGGQLADGDQALGVAVRSDVAAVFGDKIDEAAGTLGDRARIEEAVSVHEVGHLLGLVDLVLDSGREDPEHPGHSPNRGSVMYYAVESTLVGNLLGGGPPTRFDDADRAELRAIAGR